MRSCSYDRSLFVMRRATAIVQRRGRKFKDWSSNFSVRIFFIHDCTSWRKPNGTTFVFCKLRLNLKCTGASVSLLLMLLLPPYFIPWGFLTICGSSQSGEQFYNIIYIYIYVPVECVRVYAFKLTVVMKQGQFWETTPTTPCAMLLQHRYHHCYVVQHRCCVTLPVHKFYFIF